MGEFQETKPRGPVAAMFGSPGPCYGLPGLVGQEKHDPRSVHYKSPGWSFGTRHGKWGNDSSPGPAYHPNPRYSNKGPDGTPQYSLYSRTTDGHVETTPGPGQYSPEQKPVFAHSNPPAYTFGMRRKGRRTDDTPGPNNYELDPMLGPKTVRGGKKQAPSHSVVGRRTVGGFHEDLSKTPGPGNYGIIDPDTYKSSSPKYTVTGRNPLPGDSTQKPGPGSHSPEKVTCDRKSAPKFAFGIRHSQYSVPMIVDVCD